MCAHVGCLEGVPVSRAQAPDTPAQGQVGHALGTGLGGPSTSGRLGWGSLPDSSQGGLLTRGPRAEDWKAAPR